MALRKKGGLGKTGEERGNKNEAQLEPDSRITKRCKTKPLARKECREIPITMIEQKGGTGRVSERVESVEYSTR